MIILTIIIGVVVYIAGVVVTFKLVMRAAPYYASDNLGMALIGYVAVAWPAFAVAAVVGGPILALGYAVGGLLRKCTNEGER
jgi:hypothetical protein